MHPPKINAFPWLMVNKRLILTTCYDKIIAFRWLVLNKRLIAMTWYAGFPNLYALIII